MLAYIDESGLPNPNDSCTRPVLAAMCVTEEVDRQLTEKLYTYKRALLGTDVELKGTKFLTRKIFSGKYSAKWSLRRELAERVFDLIGAAQLGLFAVIMQRPLQKPHAERGKLPWQHRALLQRINAYVQQHGGRTESATLIYDGEGAGGLAGGLAFCMTSFLHGDPVGQTFTRIATTPMFVDSRITPGVQLIDMVASCIRQYEEQNLYRLRFGKDAFLSALDRYYGLLKRKTMDLRSSSPDTVLYGFYRMPGEYFYVSEEQALKGIPKDQRVTQGLVKGKGKPQPKAHRISVEIE